VETELTVVWSENHASRHKLRLPRELDALGPRCEAVKRAVVHTVVPAVSGDLGIAFGEQDLSGVRWTPEPAAGTTLASFAAAGGKLHLLFLNPERGAVSRLRSLADAVALQGEQLREKDEEIARLRERVADLTAQLAARTPTSPPQP